MRTARMTIDELARAAGTTTRNVRAHQTRGLLPPPAIDGRVGLYDQGHLDRLQLIARLQERGFSLAAITELLRAWERGDDLGEALGLQEALAASWSDETPEHIDAAELAAAFPDPTGGRLVDRAVALGILEPEEGGYRVPSPRLLQMGRTLIDAGVPLDAALELVGSLKERTGRIAHSFVRLFEEHVWEPFLAAGMPAGRLHEVRDALDRLRPIAIDAVGVLMAQAMDREVARAADEELRKIAGDASGSEAS